MNKEFDIVVHGATGFTGRLVVEYLMANYNYVNFHLESFDIVVFL